MERSYTNEQKCEKSLDDQKKSWKTWKKESGRNYTVTIAVPGSILDNAQTEELATYLVGQIGRAAAIFSVDEIVVYDEYGTTSMAHNDSPKVKYCNIKMSRLLQYLECPQYLRKSLIPLHKDLKLVGLINPLDAPHHLRESDISPYREGVVVDNPVEGKGSKVNIGLKKDIVVDKVLQPGLRVSVKLNNAESSSKRLKGTVVPPSDPTSKLGLYWGYNVRIASSLGSIFTECPYKGGYDVTIGTSERGESIDKLKFSKKFSHLLIVFGGLQGLEACLQADECLNIDNAADVFNFYLNTCPFQGSKTIRTEEAILITLSALRPMILSAVSL